MAFFDLKSTGSNGVRQGVITFYNANGEPEEVKTPTFMPVGTRGAVKGLSPEQVADTGAGIMLGNTYHLHLNPGGDAVQTLGGLREFSQWQGPMLTDSGGFQVFSLSKLNKINEDGVTFKNPANGDTIFISPEISMQIQHKLGADIIMAFDDVVSLAEDKRGRTEEAMERTHRWLDRCIVEHNKLCEGRENPPKLFGIVQGGLDHNLRKKSLDFIQSTDVDGIAIGGLSVGEARVDMHAMLDFLAPHYDPDRPHYLMGVGHPIDMRHAIERGIDMFDCVLPTRNGRHGTVWLFEDGKDVQVNLRKQEFTLDTEPLPGDSYASIKGYSKGYLRHLVRSGEMLGGQLLSIHNLRYLQAICEDYQTQGK